MWDEKDDILWSVFPSDMPYEIANTTTVLGVLRSKLFVCLLFTSM